jgi:hypothetical protein
VRFAMALPWFLTLASCWAAGEAWGALSGVSAAPPPVNDSDTRVHREHTGNSEMRNGACL